MCLDDSIAIAIELWLLSDIPLHNQTQTYTNNILMLQQECMDVVFVLHVTYLGLI